MFSLFDAKCEILRQTGVKPRKSELLKFSSDERTIDSVTLTRLVERYRRTFSSRDLAETMWSNLLRESGGTCDLAHFKICLQKVPNSTEIFRAIDADRKGFITREDLLNFIAE
jgi:hypothetical protein